MTGRSVGFIPKAGQLQFFGRYAHLAKGKAFAAYLAPLRRIKWHVYSKTPVRRTRGGARFSVALHPSFIKGIVGSVPSRPSASGNAAARLGKEPKLCRKTRRSRVLLKRQCSSLLKSSSVALHSRSSCA
jgi:hypothetical protein